MKQSLRNLTLLSRYVLPVSIREAKSFQKFRALFLSYDEIYDAKYYDLNVEAEAVQASGPISNSIVTHFNPKSVVDVGCGTGALLAAFRDRGCLTMGLEYSEAGLEYCRRRGLTAKKFNIERDDIASVMTEQGYDVATSLEVAEHLPENVADRFVALLCTLAPTVMLSAAKPGQGGTHHLNEQPQSYWIKKFAALGHAYDEELSNKLALLWSEAKVAPFYYENVMLFRDDKRPVPSRR